MLAVFAKMERAVIGKRIKRVFDKRRAEGQYIGGTPHRTKKPHRIADFNYYYRRKHSET